MTLHAIKLEATEQWTAHNLEQKVAIFTVRIASLYPKQIMQNGLYLGKRFYFARFNNRVFTVHRLWPGESGRLGSASPLLCLIRSSVSMPGWVCCIRC